jgi:thiol-disulfide isomerase/thioredoxin
MSSGKDALPLEAYVFFSPSCARCRRIHGVVKKAQKELGRSVRFTYMNLNKPYVASRIAKKYGVSRIPAIVPLVGDPSDQDKKRDPCSQLYWVGTPDHDDLCGVMRYLVMQRQVGDEDG